MASSFDALGFKLHHVGIVAKDIEAESRFYTETLGYTERTGIIHDPLATAHVQFLMLNDDDHYVELVAPDGPQSKLSRAAKKGLPLNHLCYSTLDIEGALQSVREAGSFVVQEPTPAVAFGMRRIAWFLTPDALLIELVERGGAGEL